MSGTQEPWAEQYREYLRLLGTSQLARELLGKVDLSGIIQATMLDACQVDTKLFASENLQRAWLRRTFLNNLLDDLRRLRSEKRNVGRERSLDASLSESASRVNVLLAAETSTPSVKASRTEQAELLLQAIAQLPPLQRQAIELYHIRELPLQEVARIMGRPKGAVTALVYRGMQGLKSSQTLRTDDG